MSLELKKSDQFNSVDLSLSESVDLRAKTTALRNKKNFRLTEYKGLAKQRYENNPSTPLSSLNETIDNLLVKVEGETKAAIKREVEEFFNSKYSKEKRVIESKHSAIKSTYRRQLLNQQN